MYHSHVYTISGDYVGYVRHNGLLELMVQYPADKFFWSKDSSPDLTKRV